MLKNIIRLLAIFLLSAVVGIVSQLFASEGVQNKVILHDSTVPAPPAPTQTVPFDLGPMGCPGCKRIEVSAPAPPPAEPTEEQKKKEIERITKEKELTIKGHKEAIADYEKKLKEGTSTFTDEELKTYIAKHKEAIARAEKEAKDKIAEVQAGKLPKPPTETAPPATPPTAPEEPKVPEKPEVKKPEQSKKPEEKKEETAKEKELRDWLKQEKRRPQPPPEKDPYLKTAVDAIANDTAIHIATKAVQGEVPLPGAWKLAEEVWEAKDAKPAKAVDVAQDLIVYGPFAGAVVAAGKEIADSAIKVTYKDVKGGYLNLEQATIDQMYNDYKNKTDIAVGSYTTGMNFARRHGCPPGKEQQWLAAYFAARETQEKQLTKDLNRSYDSYRKALDRDFSAFALDSKIRYQDQRRRILNAAKIYQ